MKQWANLSVWRLLPDSDLPVVAVADLAADLTAVTGSAPSRERYERRTNIKTAPTRYFEKPYSPYTYPLRLLHLRLNPPPTMHRHLLSLFALTFALALCASPATTPTEQDHWLAKHQRYCELGRTDPVDLLFIGDSITEQWLWGSNVAVWKEAFAAHRPGNMGIGGDRTEHILWRIENGTLAHVRPRVVVLLIGTNNLWRDTDSDIVAGIQACAKAIKTKLPESHLIILGVFPRGEQADHPLRARIQNINQQIASLGEFEGITFRDIGPTFLEPDGTLPKAVMHDSLHLTPEGYRRWATAMSPLLSPHFPETACP